MGDLFNAGGMTPLTSPPPTKKKTLPISSPPCFRRPLHAPLAHKKTHPHFLCHLLPCPHWRHPLLSWHPSRFLQPSLSSDCMWHANMQTHQPVVLWHISHKKTCMRISQAADPDSSNLVKKTLTDILWGDAVICLDRNCRAGLHGDYEDKQWGRRERW